MSKKKSKSYREMELVELKNKVHELKANYGKEIVKSKTGARNEKAINMKNLRRDIARVLTIITEKEYAVLNKADDKKAVKKVVAKTVAPKVAVEKKVVIKKEEKKSVKK